MASGLFDVRYSIEKAEESGINSLYKLDISYQNPIYNERIDLLHYLKINKRRVFSNRVSFTALSSIDIYNGIVTDDSLEFVNVAFCDKIQRFEKENFMPIAEGTSVFVIERTLQMTDSGHKRPLVIKSDRINNFDLLKIQSVNIDFIGLNDKIFRRISFDPLRSGYIYDTRMAT